MIFRVGGTGVPPVCTAETAVPPEDSIVTKHSRQRHPTRRPDTNPCEHRTLDSASPRVKKRRAHGARVLLAMQNINQSCARTLPVCPRTPPSPKVSGPKPKAFSPFFHRKRALPQHAPATVLTNVSKRLCHLMSPWICKTCASSSSADFRSEELMIGAKCPDFDVSMV